MVQIKKIIFFLFIFCYLFTNAQENNLKEQYKNLENNEQKLDFIFNQIVLKQIKDFQKLEQKIKTLENERDLLKQNQKQQVLKSLKDDTLSKSLEIQKLQSKINDRDSQIKKLNNTISNKNSNITKLNEEINSYNESNKKEILNTEKFINHIIRQKSGYLPQQMLVDNLEKLKSFNINNDLVFEFENYIKINQLFVLSKSLLNEPFNESKTYEIIDKLENIEFNSKFSGLQKEQWEIVDLLDNYESKCSDLSELFQELKEYGANAKNTITYLDSEISEFSDYPYLLNLINQKKESPEKTIPLYCNR